MKIRELGELECVVGTGINSGGSWGTFPFQKWWGENATRNPEGKFLNIINFFRDRDEDRKYYQKFRNENKHETNLHVKTHPFLVYYVTQETHMMALLTTDFPVLLNILDKFMPMVVS